MNKCMTDLKAATAAALLLASASTAAAAETYRLPSGSTTGGIDLTAMTDYAADRVLTPAAGSEAAQIAGGITASSDANPFYVFCDGGTVAFSDAPGFESLPVALTNVEGNATVSDVRFSCPVAFRKDFHVGAGTKLTAIRSTGNNFAIAGDAAGSPATLRIDGTVNGGDGCRLVIGLADGTVNGNADAVIGEEGSVSLAYNGDFYLFSQTAALADGFTPRGSLTVEGSLSCREVYLGGGMDVANADTTAVTNRGTISARMVYAASGGWHTFVFDGGVLASSSGTSDTYPLFKATGYSYRGSYPVPRLFVTSVGSQPIDVKIDYDRNLCGGYDNRPIKFTGAGGLVKRGAGVLTFAHNASYYWQDISTRYDVTGTTTVKGGGIKLVDDWFTPGRGALVLEATGTTYDLNGVTAKAAFTGATGLGTIVNTAEAAAAVTFGYNGESADFDVAIGERVSVRKIGAGTLTVGANAAAFAGDLAVEGGTVKLAADITGLGTVIVTNGATLDVRGHAFGCAALVRYPGSAVLTDEGSAVAIGGADSAEVSLPSSLEAFEKTGAGTLTAWGACAVTGGVTVSGGTLLVRPRDYGGKFYRIKLYANQGYSANTFISLAEFTFVDADGNRIDIPDCFWNPIDKGSKQYGTNDGIDDASGLAECEAQLWGKGGSYNQTISDGQGPEKLFDNDVNTVHGWWYYWSSANIVVRLPGAAATVAGYKMTRGENNNAPLTWSLEGSTDGKEWTMLDDRRIYDLTDADQLAAAKAAVPAQKAEYNGGVPYRLASLTNTSLAPFGALTPVTVAAGATYAASDPTTRLDALSVDLAQEGRGSVSNFTVAANGRLTVANGSRPSEPVEVPLTFADMKETANFKTWTVVFGGKTCDDLVVRWRNGSLYVIPRKGSVLIVR